MSDRTGSNIPIVYVLRELKFGRPAWVQIMLDVFIEIAIKKCSKNNNDGTFNAIVDKVFEKGLEADDEKEI